MTSRATQLTRLINRQRQIVQNFRDKLSSATEAAALIRHRPENALFHLIYFMSYHAELQKSVDTQFFDLASKIVKMFIGALLVNTSQTDDISMVINILQAIKRAQDVRDPKKPTIHILAEVY